MTVAALVLFLVTWGCQRGQDCSPGELKPVKTFDQRQTEPPLEELIEIKFFWAPWSPESRKFLPELEQLARDYPDRLRIDSINIDDNAQWAGKWNVTRIPCVLYSRRSESDKTRAKIHSARELRKCVLAEMEAS